MTKFKDIPSDATVLYYAKNGYRSKRGDFGIRMDADSALDHFLRDYNNTERAIICELVPTPMEVTVRDLAYWIVTGHVGIISDSVLHNEDRNDMTDEIIKRLGEDKLQKIVDSLNNLVNEDGTIIVGPSDEPVDMSEVEEAEDKAVLEREQFDELWDLCYKKLGECWDSHDAAGLKKMIEAFKD